MQFINTINNNKYIVFECNNSKSIFSFYFHYAFYICQVGR